MSYWQINRIDATRNDILASGMYARSALYGSRTLAETDPLWCQDRERVALVEIHGDIQCPDTLVRVIVAARGAPQAS
jgi:hypothetical protein